MTDETRNRGRALAVSILVFMVLLGMCSSCTVYKQPRMELTSVLAVTAQGDTLKLPIDVIRPIYNYNTYPTNRFPIGYGHNVLYYSPNRYQPVYGGGNYSNNNSNNPNISQSGGNSPAPRVDRVTPINGNPPNPAVNNPRKNN